MNLKRNRLGLAALVALPLLTSVDDAAAAAAIYISPTGCNTDSDPGCSSEGDGSLASPYRTLTKAQSSIPTNLNDNYIVYMRGGTYWYQQTVWVRSDPTFTVTIQAYNEEVPVFDGRAHAGSTSAPRALALSLTNAAQNVTVRGIWIRNYHQMGIALTNATGITIEDSWFENIGNKWWPQKDCATGISACGLGAIHTFNSDYNTFRRNAFSHLENVTPEHDVTPEVPDFALLHAFYLAHDSDHNTIEDNFVEHCTGDPFKVRDGSDHNTFARNYVNWAGGLGFLNTWSSESTGEVESTYNSLLDNRATFPHPKRSRTEDLEWCPHPSNNYGCGALTQSGGYLYASHPATEEILSATQADTDGDGTENLYVAFRYPGLVKVARTVGDNDQFLRHLIYHSTYWNDIPALTGGDFDGDGVDEVLTAFQSNWATRVYTADGVTKLAGTKIYESTGCATSTGCFRVVGMTSGNLDGLGGDESATVFRWSGSGSDFIYRGNGVYSVASQMLWSSTSHQVAALAAGDFDSDGDEELISALQSPSETRIVKGNGYTAVDDLDDALYVDNQGWLWRVTAMAARSDGANPPDLFVGMESPGATRVYRLDATSGLALGTIFDDSVSPYWSIDALAARARPTVEEVITIYSYAPGGNFAVTAGNQYDHDDLGEYYRSDLTP